MYELSLLDVESDRVLFDIFSIYWTVGIKVIMDCISMGATRVITGKSLSPKNQLEIISKYKITDLNLAPFDLVSYLKHDHIHTMDFSSVKSICGYGYKLPYTLVNDLKKHFRNAEITSSYGLTEVCYSLTKYS